MPIKIDMDMPEDYTECRFYSYIDPSSLIWCNADRRCHRFRAYTCRCENCPLKEVKEN